jgi:hypothetical protein
VPAGLKIKFSRDAMAAGRGRWDSHESFLPFIFWQGQKKQRLSVQNPKPKKLLLGDDLMISAGLKIG